MFDRQMQLKLYPASQVSFWTARNYSYCSINSPPAFSEEPHWKTSPNTCN